MTDLKVSLKSRSTQKKLLNYSNASKGNSSLSTSGHRISSEGYWTVDWDLELQLRLSLSLLYIVYLSWLDSDPCYALWSCLHY